MLQQTQVERVATKYGPFLNRFPTFSDLSAAPLRDVLSLWQGLGYNRRAMALHVIAQRVVAEFDGRLPDSGEILQTFPGIGKGTAGALAAFAFHRPVVFIETNIRRVFLHFFFPDRQGVSDREILPLVEQTLDRDKVRQWYYALMDYGAMLGKKTENANRRSAHHSRQSRFEGSDRQIRGLILKVLVEHSAISPKDLATQVGKDPERTAHIAEDLVREGFIEARGGLFCIAAGGRGFRNNRLPNT